MHGLRKAIATLRIGGLWLAASLANFGASGAPQIEFTHVPSWGSTENLSGRVLDVTAAAYRVAVFIYVPGAGWWSKPFCDPQLTTIKGDLTWTADVTTGGGDAQATRIEALLVPATYNQPCVMGLSALPNATLTQAVASASVYRRDPTRRWITFSGHDWWVKAGGDKLGPGPNYFSDSTNNVWVDNLDQLHLRITHRSNLWQCAEIVSQRTFGPGSYRFELGSPANNLNPNAVLGLFTWSDNEAFAHREIDIEISRWGSLTDANNAQFVVQPFDTAGHLLRYRVPPGVSDSTHLFIWETNRIVFQSLSGAYTPNPISTNVVSNWIYNLDIPQTGDENVRLNLWLMNGAAPSGNVEVEVIIKSFHFVPPGVAQGASLLHPFRVNNGAAGFELLGQPDRRYQVESSTNLSDWGLLQTVLATNQHQRMEFTNMSETRQFFRATTLP